MKNPTILKDALHNASVVNPYKDRPLYGKGIVVGIVSCLMAGGMCFDKALQVAKDNTRGGINPECLPLSWQ